MSKPVKKAAGFLLWRMTPEGHKYLLLKNAGHQTWGFPKGHLEVHETAHDGACRELLEETGLSDIDIDSSFEETMSYEVRYKKGELFQKVVHYFLARLNSGDITLSTEHDAGDWYDFDSAMSLLQHEDSKMLLTAAETLLELEQN
ncbi:MAG: 8-oxo-dGTP pyrophosphatase MutT (NUDIX family) [Planctomycetota bacterium]|jgi:8-oxo-dGTP pyrophosphatase MutT (NUDIX family)